MERLRVAEAAAGIIGEDICSKMYDVNNYRCSDNTFTGAENDVPESLHQFIQSIVMAKK